MHRRWDGEREWTRRWIEERREMVYWQGVGDDGAGMGESRAEARRQLLMAPVMPTGVGTEALEKEKLIGISRLGMENPMMPFQTKGIFLLRNFTTVEKKGILLVTAPTPTAELLRWKFVTSE